MTEWAIKDLAKATGLTSRALRHYEQIGLLHPSRVAHNGYRFYGDAEVARLYRILSLRALELPLPTIRRALDDHTTLADAIEGHLALLEERRERITEQITDVRRVRDAVRKGRQMSIDDVFSGVDDSRYEAEVRARWGDTAWERSAKRRGQMSEEERAKDDKRSVDVNAALRAAADVGESPESTRFQELVAAHHRWVTEQWGGEAPNRAAYTGLAEMYVADERFAAVYGGEANAATIRDAIRLWAATHLA